MGGPTGHPTDWPPRSRDPMAERSRITTGPYSGAVVVLTLAAAKGQQQSEGRYEQWFVGGTNTIGFSNKPALQQIEDTQVHRRGCTTREMVQQ